MVAQVVVQLVYVPLLLSGIGQEEYGLYQLVGSIMSYVVSINSVLAAGVGRYYCMYRAENDQEHAENTLAIAKRLYWILSGVSIVSALILSAVVRVVYQNSFTPDQINECVLMLFVLGVNTAVTMNNTVNIAAITAEERFVFLKSSQLITLVVQPLMVVMLMNFFPNALMVSLVVLAMNALCAGIQRVYAQGFLKVSYRYHGWDKKLVRGLLGFSVSIVMVVIADQINWRAGQLIIGYMFGAGLVAVYAVGAQIYTAYMNIGTVVTSVFLPRVSELYHGEHDFSALSALYAKIGRITFLICGTVLGAFLIVGPDFMNAWAGDGYIEAYYVASLVMISLTVDVAQNLSNTIMQVADKYYFRGVVMLVLGVVNVIVSILLVPIVGIVGAALSTAMVLLVGNGIFVNWYLARRIGIDVRKFWAEVGELLPAFLLSMACAWIAYHFIRMFGVSLLFVAAGVLVYLVVYFIAMSRFGFNAYERGLVNQVLGKVTRGLLQI